MTDTFRTAGIAGYWLDQSEMWLAELASYGVPANAINDLRQNAKAAVHEAVEATEREQALQCPSDEIQWRDLTADRDALRAENERLRALFRRISWVLSPERSETEAVAYNFARAALDTKEGA